MSDRPVARRLLGFGLMTCLAAAPAEAQARAGATRNLTFGISYARGTAQGPLAGALGDGQGAMGYLAYPLASRGPLALRLDLGLLAPDEEIAQFPLVIEGQPASVRVNTTGSVATAFFGPQLALRFGPVRPYAFGGVGVSRFVFDLFAAATLPTASARSTVLTTSATRLGAQGGLGVRVPVTRGSGAVMLDAGLHLQRSGAVDVPIRGSLAVDTAGVLTASTVRAALNYRVWRVGLAVAF